MPAHPPEREAAAYLAGALTEPGRERFQRHLLACDACWRDLQQARAGRAALEGAREVAPAALRDRVRAVVELEAPGPRPRHRAAAVLGAAAVLAAAVLALQVSGPEERPGPTAVERAVSDYAVRALPGTGMAADSAPDLSGLRLEAVGAGAGTYDGLAVDGYAYTDARGRRVVLYLSQAPFPEPSAAEPVTGVRPAWTAHEGDVLVLCGSLPSGAAASLLVVGADEELVMAAGHALGAV